MTPVLIDTSSWIEALRPTGDADVRDRIRELMLSGRAATCNMVVLELWNGARGEPEKCKLKDLLKELILLSISDQVWEFAYSLSIKARELGNTMPGPDILIVACGMVNGAGIEHFDEHFGKLIEIGQKIMKRA